MPVTEPTSHPRRRDAGDDDGTGASHGGSFPGNEGEDRSDPEQPGSRRSAAGPRSRGRHASGRGEGFGRLVWWTILGAIVPGLGLLAAGRRRTGWLVLVPVLFVVGALATVAASGRAVALARGFAFDPQSLLYVAIGVVVVALAWCLVIVVSHLALRRERLTRAQRFGAVLLVTVLMAAVVGPAATAARYAMTDRGLLMDVFSSGTAGRGSTTRPNTGATDPWAGIPRVNVLLVGADSSQGHEGTRPDTVIVASIDTKTGDTVLFGLPRQLDEIPFPVGTPAAAKWPAACEANGEGGCILNATYLFGVQNPDLFPGASDPGLEATRAAAAGITGLQIDYEAMINLDGFENLVDAMGGITLTIDKAYPIGGGHNLVNGGTYKITGRLPVGKDLHLNGYLAEWYVRSRAESDNNDRMNRQRCFINAAVQQYSVLDLARAFPALAATAQKDLETNIDASQLNAFIDLGTKVKSGALRTLSFDEPDTNTGNPDYAKLQQQVQEALVPPAPAPSTPAPSATDGTTPAPAPASDPGQAVDADTVCPS